MKKPDILTVMLPNNQKKDGDCKPEYNSQACIFVASSQALDETHLSHKTNKGWIPIIRSFMAKDEKYPLS